MSTVLAGRIVLKRDLGKLVFATIRDRDTELQVVFDRGRLDPDAFALLRELDLGDIIGVEGTVGTTRRGELSLFAERWGMLTEGAPAPSREVARAARSWTSSSAAGTST